MLSTERRGGLRPALPDALMNLPTSLAGPAEAAVAELRASSDHHSRQLNVGALVGGLSPRSVQEGPYIRADRGNVFISGLFAGRRAPAVLTVCICASEIFEDRRRRTSELGKVDVLVSARKNGTPSCALCGLSLCWLRRWSKAPQSPLLRQRTPAAVLIAFPVGPHLSAWTATAP